MYETIDLTNGAINQIVNTFVENNAPIPEPATIIIWSLLGGLGIAIAHMRKRAA